MTVETKQDVMGALHWIHEALMLTLDHGLATPAAEYQAALDKARLRCASAGQFTKAARDQLQSAELPGLPFTRAQLLANARFTLETALQVYT